MLPIETETIVTARIERIDGRKIHLRAEIKNPSGQVVADGSGLFIVLRHEQLRALERP
jgi:acyl-CoA thioesterase FadM